MASDQSDISSSAAPSPYLGHQDNPDIYDSNHSPLLNPLNDSNDYTNDFGMQNINLAEQNRISPYHSAHASPHLIPQQPQGLGLGTDFSLPSQMVQKSAPGPEISFSHVDNALQKLHEANGSSTSDMGQANQFPVPTIDIEPAPVSRQASFEPDKGENNFDTLSPPTRIRGRSKSDPHVRQGSRQVPLCGKAFARQHDRKRHEGLHSGEKKFICKGGLASGAQWGCGRRFARADALGRHFRSEAGRVCIKPLLDEEAAEKDKLRAEQQQSLDLQPGLQPVQQPMMIPTSTTGSQFMLPAALLAQYPALSNIDWSTVQAGDDPGDLSDMGGGGRSSFDASSGGEFWGEEDDALGSSGPFGDNDPGNGVIYSQTGGWS
ncbi:putative c2h2 type zinc finger domain protein [Phaeomoniella chlamydospora]|uniref:Putative c2h2 type zinc finger domain protein n=1 Tax=Phaeomoniella chlamydospora TaxID=158046 RepID=A0A0G2E404_PHACM|nr:putative c2h2 type zinc finger domain protein [Phaeomoniella chlamydospora]